MLPRAVLVVALQRVAQTVPDGIIRRHLRQLFEFVHDIINFVLEWLFEISILLFAADCAQFQSKFQQLLLNRCRYFGGEFYAVNQIVHDRPRCFGHVLVSCILPNIEVF